MNDIEKQAINFVWRNKRHQVSKKTLCTITNKGGLNMFNILYFERSLKISWLHKILFAEPDWKEFALCFKIKRLPWTGLTYHTYLLKNTNNPFWSSVISAYMNWYTSAKTSLINSPSFEPLWGNTQINIPFRPVLFKSNFLFIRDLYNELGRPLTKHEIEVRMGQPLMFTTYYGIYNAIPANWKRMILNTNVSNDLQIPPIFHFLKRCKKGTSLIRSIWEKQSHDHIPIGQQKWVAELALNETEDWCFLYTLPTTCKLNPNTIFFQFQILHRTIMTNKKLQQFNLRDNELCDECHSIEDISHLFFDCPTITRLWNSVKNWLNNNTNQTNYFDKKSILLGNRNNEPIINTLIIITKHEIYKKRWKGTHLTLNYVFQKQMKMDIYTGTVNNTLPKVLGKWSTLYNLLLTL